MKKALFLTIFSMAVFAPAFAQDLSWIHADSLHAGVWWACFPSDDPKDDSFSSSLHTFFLTIHLEPGQMDVLQTWSQDDWMVRLEDPQTDFGTHLILTSLFTPCDIVSDFFTAPFWREHYKQEDLARWGTLLTSRSIVWEPRAFNGTFRFLVHQGE